MKAFWISVFHPANYDPDSVEDKAMIRDIDTLNEAMKAAGVHRFANGLYPPATAKSFLRQADGTVLEKDGAYLTNADHVGGFWIVETATIEQAHEWGRKAAVACRTAVEVRPFH